MNLRGIKDPNRLKRSASAFSLGNFFGLSDDDFDELEINKSIIVENLISATQDHDKFVRRIAISSLEHRSFVSDKRIIDCFIRAASDDNDEDVRNAAILALWRNSHRYDQENLLKAVETIANCLNDNSQIVREKAEVALSKMGYPKELSNVFLTKTINFLLNSENDFRSSYIASRLSGHKHFIERLLAIVTDKDQIEYHDQAIIILSQVADKSTIEELEKINQGIKDPHIVKAINEISKGIEKRKPVRVIGLEQIIPFSPSLLKLTSTFNPNLRIGNEPTN